MNTDRLKNRYSGCLLGLACGDYLGAPVEFKPRREQVVDFFEGDRVKVIPQTDSSQKRAIAGHYTDDTSMALCLATSLLENEFDLEDQLEKYRKWLLEGYCTPFGDSAYGVGQKTLRILLNENHSMPVRHFEDKQAGGNGALMRTAPVALRYYKDPKLKEYSLHSAILTHNHEEAAWSCFAKNALISYMLQGYEKEALQAQYQKDHPDTPASILELVTADYHRGEEVPLPNSGYCVDTLRIALHSFFATDSFEDAINEAIFFGGDTDTQACVTGALAGAYYGHEGIPLEWREALLNREFILKTAEGLYEKAHA